MLASAISGFSYYSSVRLWHTINDTHPPSSSKPTSRLYQNGSYRFHLASDICYLRVWKLGIKGSFGTRWMGWGTFGCRSDARTQIFTALECGADVLFDLHSLAAEERKGTEGRDDCAAWSAGCGGRARVRRCAHLRILQRHLRPCNGSLRQGDHLAGHRCVSSPFRSIPLLIKNYNEIGIQAA